MNITAQVHLGPNDHIECVEMAGTFGPFMILRIGGVSIIPAVNGRERMKEIRDCIDACLTPKGDEAPAVRLENHGPIHFAADSSNLSSSPKTTEPCEHCLGRGKVRYYHGDLDTCPTCHGLPA